MNIVSVSRRTDIPAYNPQLFSDGLIKGHVDLIHPYSGRKISVSLKPEDVIAFVFWSKNFCGFIGRLESIKKKYTSIFHYTINGYPSDIEKNIPPLEESIRAFKTISTMFSPDNIIWRYDPVILTKNLDFDYHIEKFELISGYLRGYTNKCYTSFVQVYGKNNDFLRRIGFDEKKLSDDIKLDLISKLKKIAQSNSIEMFECCYPLLKEADIPQGSCIDKKLIGRITGSDLKEIKRSPTRKSCGCYKSIDIGTYSTCKGGCIYCYAN